MTFEEILPGLKAKRNMSAQAGAVPRIMSSFLTVLSRTEWRLK